MSEVIKKIFDNTPLAIIVLGTLLIIVSIVGKVPTTYFPLNLETSAEKVSILLLGSILLISGLMLLFRSESSSRYALTQKFLGSVYGFKITSPKNNDKNVKDQIAVKGTYRIKPPRGSVRLFLSSLDETEYWPQGDIEYDPDGNTWKGIVYLYDEPKSEANIIVAKVGEAGEALCRYYKKVGDILQRNKIYQWPPLGKLTDDIVIYHRIKIYKYHQ